MAEIPIPYETVSRAEAKDIMDPSSLPSCLGGLTLEQKNVIVELLAHAHILGMENAFAICEFEPDNPATMMEVYNAGVTEGFRFRETGN